MRFTAVLISFFILLCPVRSLWAQLSPGDLHRSHAFLEGVENCTQCHESGRGLSTEKCLGCHAVLKRQIKQGKGLHRGKAFKKCATCHVEHHGRDFDLVYWKGGQDNFDHDQTGYMLEGAHARAQCRDCHKSDHIRGPTRDEIIKAKKEPDHTFLGLKTNCLSCHTDEHRGQMDKKCLTCHTYEKWKPAPGFDHNKTRYPLTGQHKLQECAACHKTVTDNKFPKDKSYIKFSGLPFPACISCHRDEHNNRFGKNCRTCHNTSGWQNYKKKNFNHDKTRFPLKGQHAQLECEACHKPGKPLKIKRFQKCMDCHRDAHKAQFVHTKSGPACENCHTVKGFSPADFSVDQHQKGNFPLEGAHLAVPCIMCHKKALISGRTRTMQFRFKDTRCITCHEDIHRGAVNSFLKRVSTQTGEKGCRHCHNVQDWSRVSYNHDDTEFPLEGKHTQTACISCHSEQEHGKTYWHFDGVERRCQSCHKDEHNGQFGNRQGETVCATCHTPRGWTALRFDHNKNSRFKLEGAHKNVECGQCHKTIVVAGKKTTRFKPLDTRCVACHG